MTHSSSWVEQHASGNGQQLVVHLSGDDLRVLAAGIPVTVRAVPAVDGEPSPPAPGGRPSGSSSVDVLVRADRT